MAEKAESTSHLDRRECHGRRQPPPEPPVAGIGVLGRDHRQEPACGGNELSAFVRDSPVSGRRHGVTPTGYERDGDTPRRPLPNAAPGRRPSGSGTGHRAGYDRHGGLQPHPRREEATTLESPAVQEAVIRFSSLGSGSTTSPAVPQRIATPRWLLGPVTRSAFRRSAAWAAVGKRSGDRATASCPREP